MSGPGDERYVFCVSSTPFWASLILLSATDGAGQVVNRHNVTRAMDTAEVDRAVIAAEMLLGMPRPRRRTNMSLFVASMLLRQKTL